LANRERIREYEAQDPKRRQYKLLYRQRHKLETREYNRQYKVANKEKLLEYVRLYKRQKRGTSPSLSERKFHRGRRNGKRRMEARGRRKEEEGGGFVFTREQKGGKIEAKHLTFSRREIHD
jgi:hypothetical protein